MLRISLSHRPLQSESALLVSCISLWLTDRKRFAAPVQKANGVRLVSWACLRSGSEALCIGWNRRSCNVLRKRFNLLAAMTTNRTVFADFDKENTSKSSILSISFHYTVCNSTLHFSGDLKAFLKASIFRSCLHSISASFSLSSQQFSCFLRVLKIF